MQTIDEVTDRILEDSMGVTEVVDAIVSGAYIRFASCHASEGFCLQSMSMGTIVFGFGGTNRVIWSPAGGYRPVKDYCTPRFLAEWRERYG